MPEVIAQEHGSCPQCGGDTYLLPIVKTRQGWAHKACVEGRHS
jgi:hypothetical protein